MDRTRIVAPIIMLVVGLAGGYGLARLISPGEEPAPAHAEALLSAGAIASSSPSGAGMHQDDHESSGEAGHMHGTYDVPAAQAPDVSLVVEEDAKSGWNVTLSTDGFTFTPEDVNGENVTGEGHAHLFVDGEKVARLYGPSFHYPGDFDGTKTFRVTLNANDHSEYSVDGEVIEAAVDVTHDHHD